MSSSMLHCSLSEPTTYHQPICECPPSVVYSKFGSVSDVIPIMHTPYSVLAGLKICIRSTEAASEAPLLPTATTQPPPPSAHPALKAASVRTELPRPAPIVHPSFVWMPCRLRERRCSRRWEEERCNTRSTFETSKYNGCNIRLKAVETLETYL